MNDAVIFDVIFWTTIIVGFWYWRREKKVIRILLEEQGVPLALDSETEPPRKNPLEPDIDVPSARILATATAGLRLEADILLRDRPGERATVLMGLLRADGSTFPHPAESPWCRFEDGLETLGGRLETAPAARSFAYWHDQSIEISRADVPLPDGLASFQLRIEVWLDGRRETSTILHQRFELGSRGPPDPGGEPCVACHRPGAEFHCPRCREPHHELCLRLNRSCTRLACAALLETDA